MTNTLSRNLRASLETVVVDWKKLRKFSAAALSEEESSIPEHTDTRRSSDTASFILIKSVFSSDTASFILIKSVFSIDTATFILIKSVFSIDTATFILIKSVFSIDTATFILIKSVFSIAEL